MKQAQAMQQKLADAQARLAEIGLEGTSGGGMVKVTLKGTGRDWLAWSWTKPAGPRRGRGDLRPDRGRPRRTPSASWTPSSPS